MSIGYSGGFRVGKQPKNVGRMLNPVDTNMAVSSGIGGNDWWEDRSRFVILDADWTKELPLKQTGPKDHFELN
jgi:hypothetical protein